MSEVAKQYRQLDASTAVDAIEAAYARVTGERPSPAVLSLLAAQADLETGGFNVPNNNFGGVKEPNAANPFFLSTTRERDAQGITHEVTQQFASADTPVAGAAHWISLLARRPQWWAGLHSGDLGAYVDALATPPKYFTADPTLYANAMSARLQHLLPMLEARFAVSPARSSSVAGVVVGLLAILGTSFYLATRLQRRPPPIQQSQVST
jgi:hypothetical protein